METNKVHGNKWKQQAKIFLFAIACLLCFALSPSQANAAENGGGINATEVTLYALDPGAADVVSIPDGYATSFQLTVEGAESVTYKANSKYASAKVSSTGLVEVNYTTWYWYGTVGHTNPIDGEDYDDITVSFKTGDTEITVNADGETYEVTVHVIDYGKTYAENVMQEYIDTEISDDMTDMEKLTKVAEFVSNNYTYSADYSGYVPMILYGCGDCWASTSANIKMCEMLGIDAWARNGNRDTGAGSGHRNTMISLNGVYYQMDTGYSGTTLPRTYSLAVRDSLFSCNYYKSSMTATIYQYDAKPSDKVGTLAVPETINGYTVTALKENCFSSEKFSKITLPDTLVTIGDSAFESCLKLEMVEIPSSVTEIGDNAFTGCKNLKVVIKNDNITFGDSVFPEGTVLYGAEGSTAQDYAEENSLDYYVLDENGHYCSSAATEDGVDATCTENGYYYNVSYCDLCKEELSREKVTVEALGHMIVDVKGHDATCTEDGKTDSSYCSRCGEAFTEEETLPALGHEETEVQGYPATCTEDGLTDGINCQRCGEALKAQETIPATGHIFGEAETTKEVTCIDDGIKTYTCASCGETKTETILAKGHSWDNGSVTTAAGCTGDGVKTYTCTVCKETKTEAIPATGHQNTDVRNAKEATCSAEGYTGDTYCTDCGALVSSGTAIKANGHSYDSAYYILGDCTEPTERTSICSVCGHEKTDLIPASGHSWDSGKVTKKATSKTTGKKKYTCTACGETKTEVIPKLGSDKTSSIKLSGISKKVAAGGKIRLAANISPSNASKMLKWSSSDTDVATVTQNGVVKMTKAGKGRSVTITAKATDGSGKKAVYKIKSMKGTVKMVTVKGAGAVKAGKSLKLKATVKATKGANKKLLWKSSNTKYASVNAKGVVKAKKAGKGKTVKVTAMATDGSGKKSIVTVKIK